MTTLPKTATITTKASTCGELVQSVDPRTKPVNAHTENLTYDKGKGSCTYRGSEHVMTIKNGIGVPWIVCPMNALCSRWRCTNHQELSPPTDRAVEFLIAPIRSVANIARRLKVHLVHPRSEPRPRHNASTNS